MILTSDYSTFHSLPPLPLRLLPSFIKGRKYPPYGLRKVEAIIVESRIVPPEKLNDNLVCKEKLIGIYVNDPFGLTEVSKGLVSIFHEELNYSYYFRKFSRIVKRFKEKCNIKVLAGGPGAWEVVNEDWIDHVIIGEAEITLPKVLNENSTSKIIQGTESDRFYPIKGPSAMAEVEVMRKDRKIPISVIKEELKIQSIHGYVNLISNDLLAYGDEKDVLNLLELSSHYGKVYFSQISVISAMAFNLSKIREVLGLNENNWRSPVLSSKAGSCILKIESEVIKELNKNFIYPTIFTDIENFRELDKYKAIIIPLLSKENSEDVYSILYNIWLHNKKVTKIPFSRVVDYILYKNKETKGEYLNKLKLRGKLGTLYLVSLLIRSYFSRYPNY
ncbi:hypothetical protein V6M85_01485 [Sulfolobus tengchongensis]|uniref:Uncharacterized protein n=1 Tax=Sulfolobus tengchongensis TaxID=207809 RepID=A0AAX4L2G6_9CREN